MKVDFADECEFCCEARICSSQVGPETSKTRDRSAWVNPGNPLLFRAFQHDLGVLFSDYKWIHFTIAGTPIPTLGGDITYI